MKYRHIATGVEVESGRPLGSTFYEPVKDTRKKKEAADANAGRAAGGVANAKRKRAKQG